MGTISHHTVSLDGFVAGPADSMDWAFDYGEGTPLADETMRRSARSSPAALVWSWRSSDGMESTGSTEGLTKGTCSCSPTARPRTARTPDQLYLDRIENAIAAAQAAAGDKDVGIFGGSLSRQCLEAGLLDEIVLHVAPVLLGGGVQLFAAEGAGRIELERISEGEAEQLTDLRFRVVKRRPA